MLDRRTWERHIAREEVIENAAEAPNIALEVTWLLPNNLGSLVPNCTNIVPNCTNVLNKALIVFKLAC